VVQVKPAAAVLGLWIDHGGQGARGDPIGRQVVQAELQRFPAEKSFTDVRSPNK
jgi:hypothetical protein